MSRLVEIMQVYAGSDGRATTVLYDQFTKYGPAGTIAVCLFRAHKASARAKVYRGGILGKGSYRGMAYDRKTWSIEQACKALAMDGAALDITWGWAEDPAMFKADPHRWVLYVDLPTGQVSFHNDGRGKGPDYTKEWDRLTSKKGAEIICRWMLEIERSVTRREAPPEMFPDFCLQTVVQEP